MTTVLEHTYRPRGAPDQLFRCTDPEVVLSGPAGTGKSRGCLERLLWLALEFPGMRGLILRKTAVSMRSSILVEFRTVVLEKWIQGGVVKFFSGSAQEPAQYRFGNGSVIVLGGMDTSSRIMSTQYDIIYINEAFELTENDIETCTSRLRNGVVPFQQLILDTNPQQPTHWLKLRCDRGQMTMLLARHKDNPAYVNRDGTFTPLGDRYINGTLKNLTGVRRDRLYLGKWVAAEGAIWEEWDDAVHVRDRKDLFPDGRVPWDWQRVWSIDFGMTVPMVVQRWAIDDEGRMILYGEHYATGQLFEDVAAEHKKLITADGNSRPREPRPAWICADHDAEGRATWERHFGMSTLAAKKNVTEGLQAVASRLRVDGRTGKPRIMLMRGARTRADQTLVDAKKPTCTEEEIPGYIWEDKAAKERPLKNDDHGCDAMRYAVAQLDVGGRPSMRFMTY